MKTKSIEYLKLYYFALNWVKLQLRPFTSEDLRTAFIEAKNELPANLNVIGNVFLVLGKEEAIFKTDRFIAANHKAAHGRIIRLWISKEYRLQQQSNRLAPFKDQTQLFDT